MATRNEKRTLFNTKEQVRLINDDLDDGDKAFAGLRRDMRAIGGFIVLLLLTVIGLDIW